MSDDQFCEDPPSPWTYSAGGRSSRAGGRERTVRVAPGRPTDRSRSPSPAGTGATLGSTLAAGTEGDSVEDMRQCYEVITSRSVCSPSQTEPPGSGEPGTERA